MPIRDILKKKEKITEEGTGASPAGPLPHASEFTFLRTTTTDQEPITLPLFPAEDGEKKRSLMSKLHIRKSSKTSTASTVDSGDEKSLPPPSPKNEKRFSDRLHIGSRSRAASSSSVNIPGDLPSISADASGEDQEAQWEKRATLLAQGNPNSRPSSARSESSARRELEDPIARSISPHIRQVSDEHSDVNIQEAIRLHEAGDLQRSTAMFGTLADPNGANNALSQVLYGLALRHGWGIAPNPALGLIFLSRAASNSAAVESLALEAGMKKGGSAKGELVLAMFELANSFRNGWGVAKDPVAARQYYETAANLGDTDAMNEAAWCWLEGFGGPKDKAKAAKYLRRAEEMGHKTLGNTWIWKPKYDPV